MTWRSRPPAWAQALDQKLDNIDEQLEGIMAAVQVEQTDLDTLSTDLDAAVASVGQELTDLETKLAAAGTPLPAGSLDGLKAGLDKLKALEVPTPAPAAPPATDPGTPPVTPPAPTA